MANFCRWLFGRLMRFKRLTISEVEDGKTPFRARGTIITNDAGDVVAIAPKAIRSTPKPTQRENP